MRGPESPEWWRGSVEKWDAAAKPPAGTAGPADEGLRDTGAGPSSSPAPSREPARFGLAAAGIALLALVLAALAAARYRWLPRTAAAALAGAMLVFAAAGPDRRIAERNLDRGRVDAAYLRSLSAGAAPALPVGLRGRPAPDGLFGWNLARSRAR